MSPLFEALPLRLRRFPVRPLKGQGWGSGDGDGDGDGDGEVDGYDDDGDDGDDGDDDGDDGDDGRFPVKCESPERTRLTNCTLHH